MKQGKQKRKKRKKEGLKTANTQGNKTITTAKIGEMKKF